MAIDSLPMIGFPSLCEAMFRSACELAHESVAATGADQIRRTTACVIMCQATLEAFLGESIERLRSTDSRRPVEEREWDAIVEALDGASLEMKWLVYPRLRWKRTFDRSREPFQSFHLLISLRNALAHYSPKAMEIDSMPSGKIQSLESRFAFSGPLNSTWTSRVLNAECARWACKTTQEMIKEYCKLADAPDPWAPALGLNASTGQPYTSLPTWREPP